MKPSISHIIPFVILTLCGLALLPRLNFCLQPSAQSTSLSISVSWANAAPRVLEQEVTTKLEALISRLRGVERIRSRSMQGYASINIELDKHANADAVRLELSGLIREAYPNFPAGVQYPHLQLSLPDDEQEKPLLSYTINSQATPPEILAVFENTIKPILLKNSSVKDCRLNGVMPMEWVVTCYINRMEQTGISTNDVQNAINQYVSEQNPGSGTVINQNGTEEKFQVIVKEHKIENNTFPDVLLSTKSGKIIHLREIADVQRKEQNHWVFYRINGNNSLSMDIFTKQGINNIDAAKQIRTLLENVRKKLPKTYNLLLAYDASQYISKELNNIFVRTGATLFILLLFIFLVTRRFRYLLMVLFTLITNISIASLFYYFLKIEIHLYALAGITVSLGLMTDNIIIMSEHIRKRGNRKAWLAIFAGTLATASSLLIIFFLDEKIKLNLVDFAAVIIINQAVSLITALFFVPELIGKVKGVKKVKEVKLVKKVKEVKLVKEVKAAFTFSLLHFFTFKTSSLLHFLTKRYISLPLLILGFGIPVFLLPQEWKGTEWYKKAYNTVFGSELYNQTIRPVTDKVLGGSLRLFTEKVFDGSYFSNEQETVLYINAQMPNGTTIEQMNNLIRLMEKHLQTYKEGIRLFRTSVYDKNGSIEVHFTKKAVEEGFPYRLKGEAISKALELGGGYWSVYGVGNDGFSNDVREQTGMYNIQIQGYNYESLNKYADTLRSRLMKNPRIKEVYILPELTWQKPDNKGFGISIDYKKNALYQMVPASFFYSLLSKTMVNSYAGQISNSGKKEDIKIETVEGKQNDVWGLTNNLQYNGKSNFRFSSNAAITQEALEQTICKENQQFIQYLQFDYIGSDVFARKFIKTTMDDFRPQLPVGYSIKTNDNYYMWGEVAKKQYWLILVIITIIFFVCAILFESLKHPFAVILTVPVSFIGVFLTFYLFELNFDQGGFAAFIMLTGLTVSAAIYILNDYDCMMRENKKLIHYEKEKKKKFQYMYYFKAFKLKIVPVLLTMLSTILGFVPFLIGERQAFWFNLAAGVIGGLLFAIIGIVVYLPVFLGIRKEVKKLR